MFGAHVRLMSERSITTKLKSGMPVCLRPLRRSDKPRLIKGVAEMSDHSRYLRFFSGVKTIPDYVVERLVDVDGDLHLAWGAINLEGEDQPAIAAAHAIRTAGSDTADVALGVLDLYHSEGLARMLLTALAADCLALGISRWSADVLAENKKSSGLFKAIGAVATTRDGPVVHYEFDVAKALEALSGPLSTVGVEDVLAALGSSKPDIPRRA